MIMLYHVLQELKSEQELVLATSEQIMAKPDDVASNADTGYETGSVASASSSSQTTKVRHTVVAGVMNEITCIILYRLLDYFTNLLNQNLMLNLLLKLRIDQLTHHDMHAHKHTHISIASC